MLGNRSGFVFFPSVVLSLGATDIQEGVLVVLSRIHPIGRHRQRKKQQLFLQYGVRLQAEIMVVVVVVVVVQASLADDTKDSHKCRNVGAIH